MTDTVEQTLKWFGGALAAATAFVGIVRGWYYSRFKGVHKRIDGLEIDLSETNKVVDKHGDKIAGHGEQLAVLKAHVANGTTQRDKIEGSIRRLHDKLDKVIGGL